MHHKKNSARECVFKIVLKCCWPLKLERENARLFAWQLFRVHPEHSRVGGGDMWPSLFPLAPLPHPPPPWKFIDRQGVQVRWFIYDNGAWWHHAIKALGGVAQHMPRRVPAFVFAMHEYIRGREGHWLTLLLCDGWRRLAALFVFVSFLFLGPTSSPIFHHFNHFGWRTRLSAELHQGASYVSIQLADYYKMFFSNFKDFFMIIN